MKKQFKRILILALFVLAALFTLVGCKLGESFEDVIKQNGLVSHITYYANAERAVFTPNASKSRDIWYKQDSRPFNIGVDDGSLGIEYDGYELIGWYFVECDEDGNPITTGTYTYEDTTCYLYKLTDQKVDFTQRIKEGEHWIVAAKWTKISRVNIVLVHDEPNVNIPVDTKKLTTESPLYNAETGAYKTAVTNGDVIQSYRYEDNGTLTVLPYNPIAIVKNEYTFVAYYADVACTQYVTYPLVKTDVDQIVYAKYITGNWTVVRTADNVESMFKNLFDAAKRYYFLENAVIDCAGVKVSPSYTTACEIQGNGAIVKNLALDNRIAGDTASLFGKIEKTAILKELSFENFNMIYRVSKINVSVYFVFTALADGATIDNVKLQGTMKIVKPKDRKIENLMDADDNFVYDNCLFGSFKTDDEYYAQYPNGFKVEGIPAEFITVTAESN